MDGRSTANTSRTRSPASPSASWRGAPRGMWALRTEPGRTESTCSTRRRESGARRTPPSPSKSNHPKSPLSAAGCRAAVEGQRSRAGVREAEGEIRERSSLRCRKSEGSDEGERVTDDLHAAARFRHFDGDELPGQQSADIRLVGDGDRPRDAVCDEHRVVAGHDGRNDRQLRVLSCGDRRGGFLEVGPRRHRHNDRGRCSKPAPRARAGEGETPTAKPLPAGVAAGRTVEAPQRRGVAGGAGSDADSVITGWSGGRSRISDRLPEGSFGAERRGAPRPRSSRRCPCGRSSRRVVRPAGSPNPP